MLLAAGPSNNAAGCGATIWKPQDKEEKQSPRSIGLLSHLEMSTALDSALSRAYGSLSVMPKAEFPVGLQEAR
jgi:hypothetical protein